jgi:DNA-binding response OmpR family regulator
MLPPKIMIVEDELMSQRHITGILENLGVDVVGCFDNASDARAAITKESCDMILMDINIKGSEDGIQLSRSLLQQYNVPIVFISAYSDGETLEEVMDLSPYGFITKPFGAKDVEVAISVAYKRFQIDKNKKVAIEPEKPQSSSSNLVQIDSKYMFNIEAHTLYENDIPVRLNKKQMKLIETLVLHFNQVVDYGTIIDEVWPDGVVADSSLRTLIYSIRQILPEFPIESYSKMGYALKKSAPEE